MFFVPSTFLRSDYTFFTVWLTTNYKHSLQLYSRTQQVFVKYDKLNRLEETHPLHTLLDTNFRLF